MKLWFCKYDTYVLIVLQQAVWFLITFAHFPTTLVMFGKSRGQTETSNRITLSIKKSDVAFICQSIGQKCKN